MQGLMEWVAWHNKITLKNEYSGFTAVFAKHLRNSQMVSAILGQNIASLAPFVSNTIIYYIQNSPIPPLHPITGEKKAITSS